MSTDALYMYIHVSTYRYWDYKISYTCLHNDIETVQNLMFIPGTYLHNDIGTVQYHR